MGLHRAPNFARRAGLWRGQQPEWLSLGCLILFLATNILVGWHYTDK
jgi:hypothetical protein